MRARAHAHVLSRAHVLARVAGAGQRMVETGGDHECGRRIQHQGPFIFFLFLFSFLPPPQVMNEEARSVGAHGKDDRSQILKNLK